MYFEIDRDGRTVERRTLVAGQAPAVIEIPIEERHRGGFGVRLTVLRDHQLVTLSQAVFVPWDDKELKVSFATFRDRLRPGQSETWTVKVEGPKGASLEKAAAELLAYMYDRSLDAFVPHHPPSVLALYPNRTQVASSKSSLGWSGFQHVRGQFPSLPAYPGLRPDELKLYGGYALGGAGAARRATPWPSRALVDGRRGRGADCRRAQPREEASAKDEGSSAGDKRQERPPPRPPRQPRPACAPNFSETAFWKPQLLTGADGSASIEFTVPDSVTSWNVWVQAVTKDLKAGSLTKETKSVKELMVRPYVPRFLREGDLAELKIVVNNASDEGDVREGHARHPRHGHERERARGLRPLAREGHAAVFGRCRRRLRRDVPAHDAEARRLLCHQGDRGLGKLLRRRAPAGAGPARPDAARAVALRRAAGRRAPDADLRRHGERRRPLADRRAARRDDRRAALLLACCRRCRTSSNYPYECTEQTLNRFLSTGIVSSVFRDYPAVAAMAQELSKRDTQLETWDAVTTRTAAWRSRRRRGSRRRAAAKTGPDLIARARSADREGRPRLGDREAPQGADGVGRLPVVAGRAALSLHDALHPQRLRACLEFGVDVPKDMVERAWRYAGADLKRDLDSCMANTGDRASS